MNVPDYFEPLIGWRLWLSPNEDGSLPALNYGYVWLPGKIVQSQCNVCRSPAKPHTEDHIGMYSFTSLQNLLRDHTYHTLPVIGQIYLWGKVIVCGNDGYNYINGKREERILGYRSEFAYPKAFLVNSEHVKQRLSPWKLPIDVGNIDQIVEKMKRDAAQKRGLL